MNDKLKNVKSDIKRDVKRELSRELSKSNKLERLRKQIEQVQGTVSDVLHQTSSFRPLDDILLNKVIRSSAESDSENTLNKVNALIKDSLRLRNISCHKAVRKPARGDNQNGVVIATCGSPDDKREIMQNKSKLKDKKQYERVYIEHDRSPAERKQISNLRKLVNVARSDRLHVQCSRVVFAQQDEDRNNDEYNSRVREPGNTRYAQSDNNRDYPLDSNSDKVKMSGYTWFGQNRTSLHFRAKKGSGGVGFLVRNILFNQFYINVCEDSYEGILWLELKDKQNSQILRACVCYLVPEFSTRNINPQDYFDRLLCQIHVYQKDSDLMVFVDFNSRIGDSEDFIPGVDNLPPRNTVDFQKNTYCDIVLDFLICTNLHVLNGRNFDTNDFTYVSTQGGASVVDDCLVPYESLAKYGNFNVHFMRQLIESVVGIGSLSTHNIPDHSFLTWNFIVTNSGVNKQMDSLPRLENDVCFTKYDRNNIPPTLMVDQQVMRQINDTIEKLETYESDQQFVDTVYNDFCETLKSEMNRLLNPKNVLSSSATETRKKRLKKTWWNEELSDLWNDMCTEERKWLKAKGNDRKTQRLIFLSKRKRFDKQVQKCKRKYWIKTQTELEDQCKNDNDQFWKSIGRLGI